MGVRSRWLCRLVAVLLVTASSAMAQRGPAVEPPCEPGPDPARLVAGINCRNVLVDGYPREFLVHVPAGLEPGAPVPLVFMYHGSTGTMGRFARISGWIRIADREGFIAVFPQGLRYYVLRDEDGSGDRWSTKWNAYPLAEQIDVARRLPGYPAGAPWPADDVAFTVAMIEAVSAEWAVDRRRIFAAGFSNGGGFVGRLAHELSTVVAAVSPAGVGFAAGLPPGIGPAGRSVPIIEFLGDEDDRVTAPFGVATVPFDADRLLAVPPDLFRAPRAAFGFDAEACGTETARNGTLLLIRFCDTRPADGTGGMLFVLVRGLDHAYADGRNNDAGLRAAAAAWEYFRAHPLP